MPTRIIAHGGDTQPIQVPAPSGMTTWQHWLLCIGRCAFWHFERYSKLSKTALTLLAVPVSKLLWHAAGGREDLASDVEGA